MSKVYEKKIIIFKNPRKFENELKAKFVFRKEGSESLAI